MADFVAKSLVELANIINSFITNLLFICLIIVYFYFTCALAIRAIIVQLFAVVVIADFACTAAIRANTHNYIFFTTRAAWMSFAN
jgi:hypothetical protein